MTCACGTVDQCHMCVTEKDGTVSVMLDDEESLLEFCNYTYSQVTEL